MSYVLVYWHEDNPPRSSIVHKAKVIGGAQIGTQRTIVWGNQQLPAKIISTGTMPALRQIVVQEDGTVVDPRRGPQGAVAQIRRQVLDERRRQAVQYVTAAQAARSHFLYHMTDQPDDPQAEPAPEQRAFDFPPDAGVEDMIKMMPLPITKDNLRAIMRNLPCLRVPVPPPVNNEGPVFSLGGDVHPVYLEKRAVWALTKTHKEPETLFREIMQLCVPPVLLAMPFITAAGTKDTVAVPRPIRMGIAFYVGSKTNGAVRCATKCTINLIRDVKKEESVRTRLSRLLQRQGVPEGHRVPQGQRVPQGEHQGVPQGQRVPHGPPQGPPQGPPHDPPHDPPQGPLQGPPQDLHQALHQALHHGLHQALHHGLHHGLPQGPIQDLIQDQPQGPLPPLHPQGGRPEDGAMGWHLANALDLAEHNYN